MAIIEDNNYIISGSEAKTKRIWDRNSGKKIHEIKEHEEFITYVYLYSD